jgi:hypothetical protein
LVASSSVVQILCVFAFNTNEILRRKSEPLESSFKSLTVKEISLISTSSRDLKEDGEKNRSKKEWK